MFRGSQWGDEVHHFGMLIMAEGRFSPFVAILQISSKKLVARIWPWPWLTLKYVLLVRSHRVLAISSLTLWLHSFWFDNLFRQIWSHVRRDTWPISKIRPERNFILVPTFRITSYFHSMIYIMGRDRWQIWPNFEVWEARNLELGFEWPWNLYRWVGLKLDADQI